jgi:hypothetical protein
MSNPFHFFISTSALAAITLQSDPDDAFGPMTNQTISSTEYERYRLDTAFDITIGSTAYAMTDALVMAQWSTNGLINLILKPLSAPPTDIGKINHIIYRGIDPASLMASGNPFETLIGLDTLSDLTAILHRTVEKTDDSVNAYNGTNNSNVPN